MTPEQKFAIARDVVMLVVMALTFYWGRERKLAQENLDQRFAARKEKVDTEIAVLHKTTDDLRRQLWAAIKTLQVDVREEHQKWREETKELREVLHSLANQLARLDERQYGRRGYDKDDDRDR